MRNFIRAMAPAIVPALLIGIGMTMALSSLYIGGGGRSPGEGTFAIQIRYQGNLGLGLGLTLALLGAFLRARWPWSSVPIRHAVVIVKGEAV